ncbi:hypothetical protein B0H11DRAFT_1913016 [Mycena galericulata]|nr:hypothetical protein B0H11DRAFT_1913016 [Mycena galericulata]
MAAQQIRSGNRSAENREESMYAKTSAVGRRVKDGRKGQTELTETQSTGTRIIHERTEPRRRGKLPGDKRLRRQRGGYGGAEDTEYGHGDVRRGKHQWARKGRDTRNSMPPPIDIGAPNTDASEAYVAAVAALEQAQRALSSAHAKLMIPTISVAVAEQRLNALCSEITALKEAASRDFDEISQLRRGTEDAVKERDVARSVAEAKLHEVAVLKEVLPRHHAAMVASTANERRRLDREQKGLSQDWEQLKAERSAFEAEKKAILDERISIGQKLKDMVELLGSNSIPPPPQRAMQTMSTPSAAPSASNALPSTSIATPPTPNTRKLLRVQSEQVERSESENPAKRRRVELGVDPPLQRNETRAIIAASVDDVKVEPQIAPLFGRAAAVRIPPAPRTHLPEEAHLLALIAKVSPDASDAPDLLQRLQSLAVLVADRHHSKIQVFNQPIFFGTRQSKSHSSGAAFQHFATISRFVEAPRNDCDIQLGLVCSYAESPIERIKHEWTGIPLKSCLFALVHGPKGTKVLLVGDPKVTDSHQNEKTASCILGSHVLGLINDSPLKDYPMYINQPRREHSTPALSLALALEWMVEVVVDGLKIVRDEGSKVLHVEDFCHLP